MEVEREEGAVHTGVVAQRLELVDLAGVQLLVLRVQVGTVEENKERRRCVRARKSEPRHRGATWRRTRTHLMAVNPARKPRYWRPKKVTTFSRAQNVCIVRRLCGWHSRFETKAGISRAASGAFLSAWHIGVGGALTTHGCNFNPSSA